MSRAELRAELLKVPEWATIPVIIVSADASGRAKAEALTTSAFLLKPVRLSELFATMASVLAR